MEKIEIKRLLTSKKSLEKSKLDITDAEYSCRNGDVVLKINQVALTTNNITYAAFGDAMNYWQFFPTGLADWGHMPAWGFADVEHSTIPDVAVGERYYGYFPICSHLIVRPERVSERGFYDGAPHRSELVSAYNQYARCSTDPGYFKNTENYQSLVRPLFITSYSLADYLIDNEFFGADQLVVSSASSKTAYGTAYCLQKFHPVMEVTAITSNRNMEFVTALGCYNAVHIYDEIAAINSQRKTLYVDFSGDETLRATIHNHFVNRLVHDCFAGSAQNTEFLRETDIPGPKPVFFFAPIQIRKRNKDYGGAEFTRRFSKAQNEFIQHLSDRHPPWMQIEEHHGIASAPKLIGELHAGKVSPLYGNIVVI